MGQRIAAGGHTAALRSTTPHIGMEDLALVAMPLSTAAVVLDVCVRLQEMEMLNQTPSALHERSCKCTVHQHSSAVVMAFARSLRQLTPTLVTQLLPSSTQLSVGCGLHQQLPSAFLSLANLHTATQWHHTLLPWQQTHERHPPSNGKTVTTQQE